MSQSGGQSEVGPPVLKFPSKLGTHLSTHCSRNERLNQPCPSWTCGAEARYATTRPVGLQTKICYGIISLG
ncbi:hypothetical protein TNCV_4830271 [Trichonephila clavipes]|nr:hypothetical protein TNCV_4830271 [Trichonephila clavipes]